MSNKPVGKASDMQKNVKKEPETPDSKRGDVKPKVSPAVGNKRGGHSQGGGPNQRGGHSQRGGHNFQGNQGRGGDGGDRQGSDQQGSRPGSGDFRGGRRGGGDDFGGNSNSRGRGMGRGGRGGVGGGGGPGNRRPERNLPDTPQITMEEAMPSPDKKFTGRCRLFVGNLPPNTTEDDFKKMFEEHGEYTEVFLNPAKNFGFIRLDFRKNAMAAKDALDGLQLHGRTLRVRFATPAAALKVKYLPPHVTNELLAQAFSIFGELERAVVVVDDRGKPTGDGIVEFARKPGAQAALKRISEGVFLMGVSPRPITVEPLEQRDEEDGYSEKFLYKTNDIVKERDQPPRFAAPGSFEFEFGQKWKDLFRINEEQKVNLQMEFEAAASKLDIDQVGAEMEHQRQMLRQDLLRRQEELRRLEETHQLQLQKRLEMKQEDERRRQEERMREEMINMRRQQNNMQPPPAPPAILGLESNRGSSGSGGALRGGMAGDMESEEDNFAHRRQEFERGNRQMRQSRFDQPAGFNQGHMGNGNMGQQHARLRDDGMADDYFEAKRSRRY